MRQILTAIARRSSANWHRQTLTNGSSTLRKLSLGHSTAAELARACHLDAGAMTLLDRLEAKGLCQRERSAADRRVVNIALTEAGKAAAQAFHPSMRAAKQLPAGFSAEVRHPQAILAAHPGQHPCLESADPATLHLHWRPDAPPSSMLSSLHFLTRRHPLRALAWLLPCSAQVAPSHGIRPTSNPHRRHAAGPSRSCHQPWPRSGGAPLAMPTGRPGGPNPGPHPSLQVAPGTRLDRARLCHPILQLNQPARRRWCGLDLTEQLFSAKTSSRRRWAAFRTWAHYGPTARLEVDFFGKHRAAWTTPWAQVRAAQTDAQTSAILLASNVSARVLPGWRASTPRLALAETHLAPARTTTPACGARSGANRVGYGSGTA